MKFSEIDTFNSRNSMISKGYLKDLTLDLSKESEQALSKYPLNLAILRNLKSFKFHRKVTYLVGENGMGKSTLLEAIAISSGFNPEGGTRNFNFSTRDSHSELYRSFKISRGFPALKDGFFLRAESFFNLATEIERRDADPDAMGYKIMDYYGRKSLHEQSHGESFWTLFTKRFFGNGLYILDEPEAALSPTRQMAALVRIHELVKQNSQFIIATHSPILLAYPEALIYELTPSGIAQATYKETELYRITKQFLSNPDKIVDMLLNDANDD